MLVCYRLPGTNELSVKDIIIRGGENIVSPVTNSPRRLTIWQDSISVENALYAEQRVSEAAAVGVPHERLGEVVAAVVYVKPQNRSQVTEAALIATAGKR